VHGSASGVDFAQPRASSVLHIATVHYGSPNWIEIQARYLREHISVQYQTWTSLERIDPSYSSHFDHVIEQRGLHSDKLNDLAIEISHKAADDDLLMFLDGDAFPIADPMPLITDGLQKAPLLAVRRAENAGDPQPHPCFCVTTVGAWRRLPGDWSKGHTWVNSAGVTVSDVGANLLRQLELTNTPWVQVLRSNRVDLDPVFFAIYGDVVYHHGAAFRPGGLSRASFESRPQPRPVPRIPVLRQLVGRDNSNKRRAWELLAHEQSEQRSERIRERIAAGGSQWLTELM
jgi:hypothetical protein